jgi:hypothetical protein
MTGGRVRRPRPYIRRLGVAVNNEARLQSEQILLPSAEGLRMTISLDGHEMPSSISIGSRVDIESMKS